MADQSLQNTVRLFSLIDSSCQIQLTNVCLFSDSLFRLLKRFSTISRISLSTNQSDLLGGCLFAQGLLSYKLFLSVGDARNIFPLLFPCPCFHPFLSFILSLYPHTYTHALCFLSLVFLLRMLWSRTLFYFIPSLSSVFGILFPSLSVHSIKTKLCNYYLTAPVYQESFFPLKSCVFSVS